MQRKKIPKLQLYIFLAWCTSYPKKLIYQVLGPKIKLDAQYLRKIKKTGDDLRFSFEDYKAEIY